MDQAPRTRAPLQLSMERCRKRLSRAVHGTIIAGRCPAGSLAALLDIPPHELLGVLLQHGVDLVEEIVNVFADLLDAVADLGVSLRPRAFVELFVLAGLARLRLAASVAGSHPHPPPTVVRETYLDDAQIGARSARAAPRLLRRLGARRGHPLAGGDGL